MAKKEFIGSYRVTKGLRSVSILNESMTNESDLNTTDRESPLSGLLRIQMDSFRELRDMRNEFRAYKTMAILGKER